MGPRTTTSASNDGGRATVIVARYKYDMWIRVIMAMLILLVMGEVAFRTQSWLAAVILMPSAIMLIPLLTNEKIEFDFVHKRYRLYRFRWLVGRHGYMDLPPLDHILLRDVTLTGSFTEPRTPIGDTYGFELALVDQAHERMIVCIRYSDKRVRAIAKAVQRASGLRLDDATEEHLIGEKGVGPAPPHMIADANGEGGTSEGSLLS